MSLRSFFKNINPGKALGYGLAISGSIPAALDAFRMVSGDFSASASFAQNFSIAAAGYGMAKASPSRTMETAPARSPSRLIMPERVLIVSQG